MPEHNAVTPEQLQDQLNQHAAAAEEIADSLAAPEVQEFLADAGLSSMANLPTLLRKIAKDSRLAGVLARQADAQRRLAEGQSDLYRRELKHRAPELFTDGDPGQPEDT